MKVWKTSILGRELVVEHGKVAKQSNSAVLVRFGDTAVLATVNVSEEAVKGVDFVPLTVEFQERFYAAGKIPGGFIKREGKPSEAAILSARLIDRPIRPLFPKKFRNEIQVIVTVLSADPTVPPDMVGIFAASLALNLSSVPFEGVVAGVRIGYRDGRFIALPTEEDIEKGLMDIVVAGTKETVTMVEGEAKEVSEEEMVKALKFAHGIIKEMVAFQESILSEFNVEKMKVTEEPLPEGFVEFFNELINKEELERRILAKTKKEREKLLKEYEEAIFAQIVERFNVEDPESAKLLVGELFETALKKTMRRMIVEKGIRADGRGPKDIRPITCEVGLFPRTHGSALFTRGETQSLGIVTLGAPMDVQIIDTLLEEGVKRFMLHYNFPPFCTGEVKPLKGPSRREIGHGHLAERALKNMLPPEEEFPYTIRVVSEILESNGSSSMATVCSGSLALMDAGVPIRKHVAGVAMGLIVEEDAEIVLTDIIGMEDHYGDMDFKVAGTRDGITAFQMDCKISGVSEELLMKALLQAREARMYILDKMYETISAPRPHLSRYAPIIKVTKIDPERVADVIGPGGRVIKKIIKEYDVKVEIDDETGLVKVVGSSENNVDGAIQVIREIAKEISVGEILEGKVTRIEPYGLFIEVRPGKVGLLHQSKVGEDMKQFLKKVKVGDIIKVEVINIDDLGRLQFRRVKEGEEVRDGVAKDK